MATCGLRTIERELAPWPQWILDQVLAGAGSPSRFTPSREVEGLASVSFSPNERDRRECTLLREPAPSDAHPSREHFPPSKTSIFGCAPATFSAWSNSGTRHPQRATFFGDRPLVRDYRGRPVAPRGRRAASYQRRHDCGLVRDEGGIRSVLATIRSGMKRRGAA